MKIVISKMPKDKILTAKEIEVLEKVIEGKTRKEIADCLNISENTAKTHIAHLYGKIGVSNKSELLAILHGN